MPALAAASPRTTEGLSANRNEPYGCRGFQAPILTHKNGARGPTKGPLTEGSDTPHLTKIVHLVPELPRQCTTFSTLIPRCSCQPLGEVLSPLLRALPLVPPEHHTSRLPLVTVSRRAHDNSS